MYSSLSHTIFIRRSIFALVAFIALPFTARAQMGEALMLATQPLPSGSRGLAMGGNLISAANGIDALDFNPAAIAPVPARELSISLFDRDHASNATFFDTPSQSSLTNFAFSSLGLAAPFETTRGHFAMGISYDRVRDYTGSYSFSAINPNSSFLNTKNFVADYDNQKGVSNRSYLNQNNLAYALGLTYEVPDSGFYTLSTPFTQGGMLQSGTVTEEGGLSAIRIGAGIDIAEDVSAGATVNIFFGNYDYTRKFRETDVNHVYPGDTIPNGLNYAEITDELHQDQSGASLKLGLLVDKKVVKFGLTIETPQAFHIAENSQETGVSLFTNNQSFSFTNSNGATSYAQEFDIVTPMRIGAGISGHLGDLTAAINASYADMSQLRFSSSDVDMSSLNDDARNLLRSVVSWSVGGEYVLPFLGMSVRAGYSDEPSPYKGDPSTFDTKAISGGLGLLLSKSILLEGAYRHMTYHTSHALYNDFTVQNNPASANITDDAISRDDVTLTFKYRW